MYHLAKSSGSKCKHDEEENKTLETYLIEKTNDHEEKIALGKRVFITLMGYGLSEEGLPEEMKDALNCFMEHAQELNNYVHCDYKNANKNTKLSKMQEKGTCQCMK